MKAEEIAALEGMLDNMLRNQPLGEDSLPAELAGVLSRALQLQDMHQQMFDYAVKLSKGDLEADPPPRRNYLAAGLKQLQAQMRHLTWQAQCVAEGDYNQRVDFMGAFSDAFNLMADQLREREESLLEQREALIRVFDRIDSVLLVVDESGEQLLFANRTARQRFHSGGEGDWQIDRGDALLQAILAAPIQDGSQSCECQVEEHSSGRWYDIMACHLHWGSDALARLYYCVDITIHKRRELELELEANTDKLTNICNRRAFDLAFAQRWEECARSERPLALLMFDIDFFKRYNDTYGHLQGDVCLAQFAALLGRMVTRPDDIVARYGGEEFVALLPFTTMDNAQALAESIRAETETLLIPLLREDGSVQETGITVSIGVSCIVPDGQHTPAQLISAADNALYRSKKDGRNRVYTQPMATWVAL